MVSLKPPKYALFFCVAFLSFAVVSHPRAAAAIPGDLLRSIANPRSNPPLYDYFGFAIADLGNTFVVGSYDDDPGGVQDAGSIYQFDANSFNLIRKIANPAPQSGAQFGKSLVALGDRFAVATAFDESSDSVGVFDAVTGGLLRTIEPPSGKYFGGVYFDAITLASAQERLWVQGFRNIMAFDPADGSLVLDVPAPNSDPYFGRSIAARGSELVVAGRFDIYTFDGTSGQLLSTIPSPAHTQVGQMTITPAGHIFATYDNGTAYLFDASTHQPLWTIAGTIPDQVFCCGVAAVGNFVIVGHGGYKGSEGIAYLIDGSTGQIVRTIHNPSGGGIRSAGEYFGDMIVPFGSDFMIGVIQADLRTDIGRDAGAVYVFKGPLVPEPRTLTFSALTIPAFLSLRFRSVGKQEPR